MLTGVATSFPQELNEPSARGANHTEVEWCRLMLNLGYISDASNPRHVEIRRRSIRFEGGPVWL
jgi:hypothetical protein